MKIRCYKFWHIVQSEYFMEFFQAFGIELLVALSLLFLGRAGKRFLPRILSLPKLTGSTTNITKLNKNNFLPIRLFKKSTCLLRKVQPAITSIFTNLEKFSFKIVIKLRFSIAIIKKILSKSTIIDVNFVVTNS